MQRLQLLASRDLARDRSRDALVGRALHQPQRIPRPIVGKHLQKRRLLQRHRQRHLERAVEHRFAGRVLEVGEDDRVLLGQRAGVRRDEERGGDGQDGHNRRDARRRRATGGVADRLRGSDRKPDASPSADLRQARRHLERRRWAIARIRVRAPASRPARGADRRPAPASTAVAGGLRAG